MSTPLAFDKRYLGLGEESILVKTLKQSYDWCYRVARGSGSSFYRAFWLLDRPQRMAMFALYAFARITDDLGDEPQSTGESPEVSTNSRTSESGPTTVDPADAGATGARLAAWGRLLADHLAESVSRTSPGDNAAGGPEFNFERYERLWPALRDTVARYGVPPSLLQELVTGVAMDAGPTRFADWSAVDNYSYHVASTVGLACTRIWQAADTLPKTPAIDCGLAFQLTNILRDVREDAARNRIYLPMSELERFGCDEASWLAGKPQGDWQGLIKSAIQRARSQYESGKHTIDHLPRSGKRIFGLMWSTYHQLLNTVEKQQAALWSPQRVRLTAWQRSGLLFRALVSTPSSSSLGRG